MVDQFSFFTRRRESVVYRSVSASRRLVAMGAIDVQVTARKCFAVWVSPVDHWFDLVRDALGFIGVFSAANRFGITDKSSDDQRL